MSSSSTPAFPTSTASASASASSPPSQPSTTITIRPATLSAHDPELLVDFQDSQLPWLATIGSGEQWGNRAIRDANPTALERTRTWVGRSERNEPWSSNSSEWCRAFVAEATSASSTSGDSANPDANSSVSVAGLVLDCKAPAYVSSVLPEQDESDPFVYLAYLISNRHAGDERKGAATALIEFAKALVREVGVKRICLDCWRGNDRKLVRYYESQGFTVLRDFTAGEKEWQGCVLEMRL